MSFKSQKVEYDEFDKDNHKQKLYYMYLHFSEENAGFYCHKSVYVQRPCLGE